MSDDTRAATSDRLAIRRIIDASPERVYAAWTNPALLAQWWGPPGSIVTIVECDIRVGGQYRFAIQTAPASTYVVYGSYQVVQPLQKLVFSWRWEDPAMDIGSSLVTIEFQAQGECTEVVLTHTQLPSEEARNAHHAGWVGILDHLDSWLHQ
jgi:uncharacterized protein YndB with AHSA1/START domain